MEPRRYLTMAFASPSATALNGVRSPLTPAQFTSGTNLMDLAVAAATSVKILQGNLAGTFSVGGAIALPANPPALSPFLVGNFSGNGPDIVLLSQNSSTHNGVVTYETSQNNATFIAQGTSPITDKGHGFNPIVGTIGNFEAGINDDLAIVGKPTTGTSLVLAILTSNGDGSFTETQDYPITGSVASGSVTNMSMATADLGNGSTDIVLYDGSGAKLDVFMGAGNGTFTQLAPVALTATRIVTGIFTSRGVPDVIAINGTHLTALLGKGDGTFTAQAPVTMTGSMNSIAAGDMDLDGKTDIVTNLGVSIGNGDGTFQAPVPLPIAEGGSSFASGIVTADMDGDGRIDVVGLSSAGNAFLSVLNISTSSSTTSLVSSLNPAQPGDDVQFTAAVTSDLSLNATGTVDFFDNGNPLGSVILQEDGTATFDAGTNLIGGVHAITAHYNGDSDFAPSGSAILSQLVLSPTTTVVISNKNPSNAGDAVTFTATVTGDDGRGDIPTGKVEFFDGATDLGGSTLDAGGNATFQDSALSGGVHEITTAYQADANFAGSTSVALAQAVNQAGLSAVVTDSTLPAAVIGGAAVHGFATVELTNNTASTISGPVAIAIFASVDGSINGATVVVAPPAKNMVIAAGGVVDVKLLIKALPATLTDGDYFLIAQVVYNSGTISAATTGPTVRVAAPFVSLSENFPALKLPPVIIAGTTINGFIKIQIANSGNIAAKGSITIDLSASQQQDQAGAVIGSVMRKVMIKIGGSQTISVPIRNIPLITEGGYFLVVQITDTNGGVSTASPESTINIAAPVVALSATLDAVVNVNSGDTLTIFNNGNVDDVTSLNPTLGFSLDAAGAQPFGSTTVALVAGNVRIKAGKSVRVHLNQWKSLLSSLTPGVEYFLTVTFTDDGGRSVLAASATSFTA